MFPVLSEEVVRFGKVLKREREPKEMARVTRAECLAEEMAQEEMRVLEEHRIRWADMDEDLEMERMFAIEEQEEQREAVQGGELEMAEEREWEGKVAQDEELAAMEERGFERRLEECEGGEGDAERESKKKWVEVWVPGVCLWCGEEVFLGCKCENGLPEAGSTGEVVVSGEKEADVERRDDDDGWKDRGVGGQRENGNAWNSNRREKEQGNGGGKQQCQRGEEDSRA